MRSRHLFRAASVLATTRLTAAVLATTGLTAAVLAAPVGAAPLAHAAKSCSVGTGRGFGYSYLTSLSESGTTCGVAAGLARRHGRVSGWSCNAKRLATSPVQYVDQVACRHGSASVAWTFSQNT